MGVIEETVGISRVTELENTLGEILDLFEAGEFAEAYVDASDEMYELIERARRVLDRDEEIEED